MKVLVRHEVMHVLASISIIFAYLYIINSNNVTGKVFVSNPLMPLIHKKVFKAVIRTCHLVSTQQQSTSFCILLLCSVCLVPWPSKDHFHDQTTIILCPESISFNDRSQLSFNRQPWDWLNKRCSFNTSFLLVHNLQNFYKVIWRCVSVLLWDTFKALTGKWFNFVFKYD
jgi:hypothetical protein